MAIGVMFGADSGGRTFTVGDALLEFARA